MSKCEVDRPAKSSAVVLKSERNARVDSEIILTFFQFHFKLENSRDYKIYIQLR